MVQKKGAKYEKTKKNFFETFLNHGMKRGKKSKMYVLIKKSLERLKEEEKSSIGLVFHRVFCLVRPLVEVRYVRVRRSSYLVPFPTTVQRQKHLVCLWILETISKNKSKISFDQKLYKELIDILEGRGSSLKKKASVYQMAQKNRSNMHYRWY